MPNQKKFLDAAGVTHLVQLLDNYPNNEILGTVISSIQEVLNTKGTYSKPAGGIPASDIADGVIPDSIMDLTNDSNFVSASFDNDNLVLQTGGQSTSIAWPVQDVRVNGTSILNNGVANVPIMGNGVIGVAKTNSNYGIGVGSDNQLMTVIATTQGIKSGEQSYNPVTPVRQHISTFYGLAKAAGDTTQSASSNPVGVYTADALVKIQKMLGVYKAPYRLIKEITITEETGKIYVNKDVDGSDLSLTDVIVQTIDLVATNIGDAAVSANSGTNLSPIDGGFIAIPNGCSTTAQNSVAIINIDGGRFFGRANSQSYNNIYSSKNYTANKNASGILECSEIYELCFGSLNSYKFTSGTIKIYGR